jgi:hypothetical protein
MKIYACLIGKWVCLNDDPDCTVGESLTPLAQWYKEGSPLWAPFKRKEENEFTQLDYVHICYFGKDYRINPIFMQVVSE